MTVRGCGFQKVASRLYRIDTLLRCVGYAIRRETNVNCIRFFWSLRRLIMCVKRLMNDIQKKEKKNDCSSISTKIL